MIRRYRSLMVLALPAILLAAACGGGTSSADKTATAGAKPAGTTAATKPAGTATSAAPAATTYPLTVTDMLKKSVTIPAEPKSIAAISPTTVEFVFAVGATSKTRPTSSKLPAAASAKDIGSSYQPNLELIAAEKPDLIVADAVLQPQLAQSLASLNVPVLYVGASNFADVLTGLDLIGKVLNKPAEAAKLKGDLQTKLNALKAKEGTTKPKVLILNGAPQDFYAAKPESYVGDLVQQLGADNVAKGQPDVGQFPGYTKLQLEAIIADAPDVILAITAGPPGGKTITETLSADPAWATIPAVKNKRVSEISAELFLQAPGPRVGDALDQLAKLLYPTGTSP